MTRTATPFASAADPERYGEYRIVKAADDPRPLYRFTGRVVAPGAGVTEGPGRFVAAPGRFHLYAGWFCPWAQRSTLVVALAGLEEAVSVSYVDGVRDARGWAFRETHGPDPVNGFTLLREAYDATEPGFDGHVSVPTLWDRHTGRVASNDYGTLDADLASQFRPWSGTGAELYPADRRAEIDDLERWLLPTVNQGVHRAAGEGPDAHRARSALRAAFNTLDDTLAADRYLLGDRLTLADVRLFVTLARYDAGVNADGRVGPRLNSWPSLWDYARDLYRQDGFRATTRFETFTAPGAARPPDPAEIPDPAGLPDPAELPDWDEPVDRTRLS